MTADSADLSARLREDLADRYWLREELGRGGMATVYVAEDIRHERVVAIKVLHPERTGGIGAERFLREIQACARLTHPHIMPLLDSGRVGDVLYYVMPRVDGETLRDLLDRTGPLPVSEALRLAGQIADGLACAHRAGLVHRDIKPENVLLSSGHAVITDFGIARALDEAGDARLTQTGSLTGTPAYMSPEQWEGTGRLDGRCDQYALACLLYEMLTGERPYTGATLPVLMMRHISAPIPSAHDLRPDVPEAVDAAIQRAMAKAPAERYADLEAFGRALGVPPMQTGGRRWSRNLRGWRLRPGRMALAGIIVAVGAAAVGAMWALRDDGPGNAPTRLVVLPFENHGPAEHAYFADGISEEITNRLAGVGSLVVIGRTSAMQYRSSSKGLRQIGQELNVEYVIEGTVRWDRPDSSAGSVRIAARLIRARDGDVLWPYDTTAAVGDVFAIQARIAEHVTRQFNLLMQEPERQRLTIRHTDNLDAYQQYLQGNAAYERSWSRPDVESALEHYQRAVDLDPEFALAWAKLSRTHSWVHQLRFDVSQRRLVAAKEAADRALALDPGLAEAHIALGSYWYWGRDNYERALEEFTRAGELQPSNADVFLQVGHVRRRQGRFEAALESYQRSAQLDPRWHRAWFNLGETYLFTRRYEEAEPHLARVTELAPAFLEGYIQLARLAISARGDLESARRILRQAEERIPPTDWRAAMLDFARIAYGRDLHEFLSRLRPGAYGLDSASYHMMKARMIVQTDGREAAAAQFDSARVHLERRRDEQPGEAWIHGLLGTAYAGLGRPDEAVRSAGLAVELLPHSGDALDGPEWIINLGHVHALLGDMERAAAYYDQALAIPSWISVEWLRLDPLLEPFRATPHFQMLARKWARANAVAAAGSQGEVPVEP